MYEHVCIYIYIYMYIQKKRRRAPPANVHCLSYLCAKNPNRYFQKKNTIVDAALAPFLYIRSLLFSTFSVSILRCFFDIDFIMFLATFLSPRDRLWLTFGPYWPRSGSLWAPCGSLSAHFWLPFSCSGLALPIAVSSLYSRCPAASSACQPK